MGQKVSASQVRVPDSGKTLDRHLRDRAVRPVRGLRKFEIDRIRAVEAAIALSNPATTPIYGFARYGNTTGGFGITESQTYDPEGDGAPDPHTVPFVRFVTNGSDDINRKGSLRWACAEILAKGGGYIVVHPRGPLATTLKEPLFLPNNLTFCAPGRNYEIRTPLNQGAIRFFGPGQSSAYGRNIIVAWIKGMVEGGGNVANYDIRPGEVDFFNAVPSYGSNRIAVWECEVSGATDGFFDIGGGAATGGPYYFSVCRTVVRNVDKVGGIGAGPAPTVPGNYTGDARLVFATFGENHFEGCSERKPIASVKAFVHYINNVDDSVRHYRDYTEGSNISVLYAGNCRYGGQLLYEGNIVRVNDPAVPPAMHGGITNDPTYPGAAKLLGNSFQQGIAGTSGFNEGSVLPLPSGYIAPARLPHADLEAEAKAIIDKAGAGRTNWPDGLYAPIKREAGLAMGLHVNGEQVLFHENQYWARLLEEGELEDIVEVDALNLSRGGSLAVLNGAITLLGDRVFAIAGEGGLPDNLATINFTTDPDIQPITGGLIYVRAAGAAAPITLIAGGNIAAAVPVVVTSTRYVALLWDGASWVPVDVAAYASTVSNSLTLTAGPNATSPVLHKFQSSRSADGKMVTFSGAVGGTATAADTLTEIEIALPIASNFAAVAGDPTRSADASGTCCTAGVSPSAGVVYGNPAQDRLVISFRPTAAGPFLAYFTGQYEAKP